MVQSASLLPKMSCTWSCPTVRALTLVLRLNIIFRLELMDVHVPSLHILIISCSLICCDVVYSRSETVRDVGGCVWTHYLTVTGKERRGEAFPLSAAQQQEVWVQYSALQIALQVRSHLQTLVSYCNNIDLIHWCFVHHVSSGLSWKSKEPPERHFSRRIITHSPVSHIFCSGTLNVLLRCNSSQKPDKM